jgi:GT2 family glycosyltransferase
MSAVDVIVLDIDGGAMLDDCLASIRAQSLPARILVFDNGSRLPVAQRVPGVEVLRSETNLGFAGGANAAFRETTAPYVALVNNDVVLHAGWLVAVVEALDRDARLAAAQTLICSPDGLIDGAGIDVSDGTFRQIGHGLAVGSPLAVAWGVSATAVLYRRSGVGDRLFDERFFAYYEDVELCARLRAAGWRTAVLPMVLATHRGSSSAGALGGSALRLRTRNRYFVARLHHGAGRIGALLWEDARLALRGRTSLPGVMEGLFRTLEDLCSTS